MSTPGLSPDQVASAPVPGPDSDPAPAAASPQFCEAEVQSLVALIGEASTCPASSAETSHWDLESMAPLNAVSTAAIARLRAYRPPPFPLWDRLPVSRRAAVLLLLYADRHGDLRVVITMRAASLRSFSGHAAFPGGKADTADETPYQIARREAWEEIGLPMDDNKIPHPFKIEFLCHLPHNLARNSLVVRPCIALLHTPTNPSPSRFPPPPPSNGATPAAVNTQDQNALIPRLDAREVAAVFSAPFRNFLRGEDHPPPQAPSSNTSSPAPTLPPGHWYDGAWISWKDHPWRVHNFYVPVTNQRVAKPPPTRRPSLSQGNLADELDDEERDTGRYKVWGMTAKILVDAARAAYDIDPEFEHNDVAGDEKLILLAEEEGAFWDKAKSGEGISANGRTLGAGISDEAAAKTVNGKTGDGEGSKSEPAKM